ncbi:hypothetical protein C8D92_11061 [Tamilnaduibacter salinus]|uniref:Uncharacterized protein n=2 Tax=Tamilnaduibacter salinus TaxID=1484056 RepID=A0A2U1CTK6_9GAMM|nr:hypothetical protein C8D92_11061 [Tamilnaduibacter salinus]
MVLAVLFLALIVLVPLLEKYARNSKSGGQAPAGVVKWIFPLLALVIVLRLLQYYFG